MNMRTINRQLIVHNDLAIGKDPVVQTRGSNIAAERMIELDFIFRTTNEIRYLDFAKYTRVSLHTDGPLIQYYFDILSAAVDDGDTILAPLPAVTLGRWLKTGVTPEILNYTTTNLADISNIANTSVVKKVGLQVWNSTTNKPVWAKGNADNSVWVDATGATVHTPV